MATTRQGDPARVMKPALIHGSQIAHTQLLRACAWPTLSKYMTSPCKALGRQVRMRGNIRRLLIGGMGMWYFCTSLMALVALRHRFRYDRLGAQAFAPKRWRHSGTRGTPHPLHGILRCKEPYGDAAKPRNADADTKAMAA
jgi:hypothetical protein